MQIPFTKMHGLGNDFVVLDGRTHAIPEITGDVARRLSDRHRGIGCDQLIVLGDDGHSNADFTMRIFNADGSEVEACGNASRAVALYHGTPARVATKGGVITLGFEGTLPSVDMGNPRFGWDDIPLDYPMDTCGMPLSWDELSHPDAVNVGNPHAVFFVPDASAVNLAEIGPVIENDPVFKNKVNVNVASVVGHEIHLRVWERGAGLTQACGTGACATAVAAIRRKLVQSPVQVNLPGGALIIRWQEGASITMTGPAQRSFTGEFMWGDYA